MNSYFQSLLDVDTGKKMLNSVISTLRKISIANNDLPARLSDVIGFFCSLPDSQVASGQTIDGLQLRVRNRLSMSIVYDSLWVWRNHFQASQESNNGRSLALDKSLTPGCCLRLLTRAYIMVLLLVVFKILSHLNTWAVWRIYSIWNGQKICLICNKINEQDSLSSLPFVRIPDFISGHRVRPSAIRFNRISISLETWLPRVFYSSVPLTDSNSSDVLVSSSIQISRIPTIQDDNHSFIVLCSPSGAYQRD
jgi:hypothetical protein